MPNSPALPALITVLTVFLQVWMMMIVGRARGKFGIEAPASVMRRIFFGGSADSSPRSNSMARLSSRKSR